MSSHVPFLVFQREMRDALRDRRGLFVDYGVPFLLWPTLFFIYTQIVGFFPVGEVSSPAPHKPLSAGTDLARILMGLLPIGLPFILLASLFHPLVDTTAGEKERGTLATLLVTGADTLSILWGKFFSVLLLGLAGVAVNMVSLLIFFPLPSRVSVGQTSLLEWVFILLIHVPLAGFYASAGLALFSLARSYKEEKSYFAPYLLGMLAPVFLCLVPTTPINLWTMAVPGLNCALITKMILGDKAPGLLLVITSIVWNVFFALASLRLAAAVFASERHRFADFSGELKFSTNKNSEPGLVALVFLLALAFLAPSLVLGRTAALWGWEVSLILLQVFCFLCLPILAAHFLKWQVGKVWGMNLPKRSHFGLTSWLFVVVLSITMWAPALMLARFVAPPEELLRGLIGVLNLQDRHFWQVLTLYALLPAVCEEALFRGPVYFAFRKLFPARFAILINGVLFGLAHGVFRALPTGLVGLLCAYLREQSNSLLPGMVLHALHNCIIISLLYFNSHSQSVSNGLIPWGTVWWVVCFLFFCAGLFIFLQPTNEARRHF